VRGDYNRGAMATAVPYFALVREMKDPYNHRLRLVESAKRRGVKPTARLFAGTPATVRKWLRRYNQHGPSGLIAQSRARHHQPRRKLCGRVKSDLEEWPTPRRL
jgi:transposase-like protein